MNRLKMTLSEVILVCENLINCIEQKSFTSEQGILQIYMKKERFVKERLSKSRRERQRVFDSLVA